MGEREGLVSLIDNLVDNAIKYSPAHATISVRLQRQGDQAVLQVRDRGPALPRPGASVSSTASSAYPTRAKAAAAWAWPSPGP